MSLREMTPNSKKGERRIGARRTTGQSTIDRYCWSSRSSSGKEEAYEIAKLGEVAARTGLPATRKPPGLTGKNEQPRTIPCRTSSLDTSTHLHSTSTQHNTARPTTQRLGKTTKRTRTTRPHKQNPTKTLITQPSSAVFGLKILARA